jgi:hypothetical protein
MPEVKKRTATGTKPVTRRRDLTVVDQEDGGYEPDETTEADDDEYEVVEVRRKKSKPVAEEPEPEEEPETAEAEETEEEEEQPRKKKTGPPPGIRLGNAGAEQTKRTGASGPPRLKIEKEPKLIKFLEPESLASFRQHWIPQAGGPNRPYICPEKNCPLCDLGNNPGASIALNVLNLSADGQPANELCQIGIKAWESLKEIATDRKTGKLELQRHYFAVSKSGKVQTSQTNWRPVKESDIEDDWPEVLENFEMDELPSIIKEAKGNVFDWSVFTVPTIRQLRDVAKYLSEDPEDTDE